MIRCTLCEFQNIEGVDVCEQCGQPLDETHLPDPKTIVERGLIGDTIAALSPRSPIAVQGQTTVQEVLELLVQNKIGCVVVVEDERPIGIFSERDALVRLDPRVRQDFARPISELMTAHPQTLSEDARLVFAIRQMDLGGFRHVPIVDPQGRLSGVISVRDLLRYLTEKMTAGGPAVT